MDDFRFSVLLPVYKKDEPVYLKESLASMFAQSLLPDEVIVIKDGELTQELDAIVAGFKNAHPDRLLIFQIANNIGLPQALNLALPTCRFPWVARMDSDDIAKKDRFEKQINFLRNNLQVDILGTWIEEFEEDMQTSISIRKVPAHHQEILLYAKTRNPLNHMTVIFRKEKVLQVGGYPTDFKISEDYGLWIHMLLAGCTFANLQELLVDARTGKGFIKRRSGFKYLQSELKFLAHLKQIRFYNRREYLYNYVFRAVTRLMPEFIVSYIYKLIRKF